MTMSSSPDTSRQPEANAATQLADLTAQLNERDELVQVLTQRLEAAAEQLDRIRRNGGDRVHGGGGGGSAGLSPDWIKRQTALTERLEFLMDAVEELKPLSMLERVDRRVEAMIDVVREGGNLSVSGSYNSDNAESSRTQQSHSTSNSDGAGEKSDWEKMKAELMGDSTEEESTEKNESSTESSGIDSIEQKTGLGDELDFMPTVIPELIDIEIASMDDLKSAVVTRDVYIAELHSELRRIRLQRPVNWKVIREMSPSEMKPTFEKLEQRLQVELKKEELDLSLERAKVAREQGQLEQIRRRLEKEIRRLGSAQQETGGTAIAEGKDGKGWRGLFGKRT